MSADGARDLISMGLEVDSDSDADGTYATPWIISAIDEIDASTGLVEILASLVSASTGAAEIHKKMDREALRGERDGVDTGIDRDPDLVDTVARLKRFAAHIEAARKEIA